MDQPPPPPASAEAVLDEIIHFATAAKRQLLEENIVQLNLFCQTNSGLIALTHQLRMQLQAAEQMCAELHARIRACPACLLR